MYSVAVSQRHMGETREFQKTNPSHLRDNTMVGGEVAF